MTSGIVYVAFGERAHAEVKDSIASLRRHCPDLPVTIINEDVLPGVFWDSPSEGLYKGSRVFMPGMVKPQLWELSPYEHTLYLDADTRIKGDILPLFGFLEQGWDMGFVPGQAARFVCNTDFAPKELEATLKELGCPFLHYYNSGVILWRKNEATRQLFETWGQEWQRFRNWDEQMALMRALWRTNVKFITLPTCWNSRQLNGAIIFHDTGNGRAQFRI